MLGLRIAEGESLLARDHFELTFRCFHEGRTCRFTLMPLKSMPYTIAGVAGSIRGGTLYEGKPVEFDAPLGTVIRVGESRLTVWKAKGSDGVKISIEAPNEVRFSRPSQHGSSPPEGYNETVVSE